MKALLKYTFYAFGLILTISAVFYAWHLYKDWKYKQHYATEITFYCKHKFVGCANENEDFQVVKVDNPDFAFLMNEMVSLCWNNNSELDKLRTSAVFLTQELKVKGIVYKNKFNVAVSPMYDCKLYAYRVDVSTIRPSSMGAKALVRVITKQPN
ncbi:MAG: hypothetical protein KBB37_01230 [Bacteroidia bacterium]|nr:hypothetical protein [Bacteroidia bacterium]MBP7259881.1 hypothetical protein [Bacteroidia bacterium]MBP9179950.1 hypothetical protein [Bacteroidia bacterium]MBP9723480.1 hypothetical protein [Bacteroidia bacterium]